MMVLTFLIMLVRGICSAGDVIRTMNPRSVSITIIISVTLITLQVHRARVGVTLMVLERFIVGQITRVLRRQCCRLLMI